MATSTLLSEVFGDTASLPLVRGTPVGFARSRLPFLNHSLPMIHAKPISAWIKEHKGFGGTMNWTDTSHFGLVTNEKKGSPMKKFQCLSKKNNDQEQPGPNIYTIIVGSSFCIAIAIFSLGFRKKLGICHTIDVPYSCLVDGIRDESVTHVQFMENSRLIYYNTKPSNDKSAEISEFVVGRTSLVKAFASKWQYQTRNVKDDVFPLIKMLKDHGITYGSDPEPLSASMKNVVYKMSKSSDVLYFIFNLAPGFILMLLHGYVLSVQLNLLGMTKRKKRKVQPVTFADVEGVDDAKAELLKIVSCINKDAGSMKLGSKLPKGVLLTGPSGTGKTLLARAFATEVGVSFHAVCGSEFVGIYFGMGASRVRELFEKARKSAPSIIFIDEIDAVGGHRGRTLSSESDQTLNELLKEMDGFYEDDNVMVLAATNRPAETLGSSFIESRSVYYESSCGCTRSRRNVPMQEDKENICDYVASRTEGLVGSDLKEIADESQRLANGRDGEFVTFDDVRQAVDRAQQNYQAVKKTKTNNSLRFLRWL
ncbi:ATPase, AAA-type, core [Artemisia annua]|uniref:ATPase, AAA-type, core n=1 Tax=Artemisia annua TaxID=35608 RepID=A0A2U1PSA0_ARTAN|nr:ATPase, AAA-type, core [Artemisia annua]